MRILILAAAVGAVALPASGASAQNWGGNNRVRQEQRECQRELRHADSRWEYQRELRECRREISQARRQQYRGYDRHDRHDRYDDGYRGRYR
jgi:Ni/Co efflux regulator RcnB